MAKEDQWFKFFYRQFIISTQGWKDDEVGAYIRLLIKQFDSNGVPDDPVELNKLITSYKKNWPLLSKKFKKNEDGLLRNDFMAEIRKDRDEKSKKGKEIGSLGGRPPKNEKDKKNKPLGYQNKTHISYSDSLSTSLSLDEEVGTGEEETNSGFYVNELPKNIPIDLIQIANAKEFISITCSKNLTDEEIFKQWEAFKIQVFGQREWYDSTEKLMTHFRNSLKNTIQKNGNKHTTAKQYGSNRAVITGDSTTSGSY